MFVNSGLLMRSESANQVIGVMAHETGHIAGGHLIRSTEADAQRHDPIDSRHDRRSGCNSGRGREAPAPAP